jgi:hypothetical protein
MRISHSAFQTPRFDRQQRSMNGADRQRGGELSVCRFPLTLSCGVAVTWGADRCPTELSVVCLTHLSFSQWFIEPVSAYGLEGRAAYIRKYVSRGTRADLVAGFGPSR